MSLSAASPVRGVLAAADQAAAIAGGNPTALIGFPGPWQFQLPKGALILVSDRQLDDLTDPDREVDLSLSATPNRTTLRKICEQQRDAGARTVILAFDEFWSQYRQGQGGEPRRYTPDTEDYVQRIARISETLKAHGLGLELSLLSPLEIGSGYARQTGESGRWVHYREGWRDPRTGAYTVSLWEQLKWTNNKGTIPVTRSGLRVFAFRERRLGNTSFYVVPPSEIVELTQTPELEAGETAGSGKQRRLTVRGRGDSGIGPLDRVLVVVRYTVPEMDYFSPRALPFLQELVRRYHAAGVPLNGLYADEMHIQQDWGYHSHHEEGQFALRYLTPSLAAAMATRFGAEFADLERALVYFCYGQHGFYPDLQARLAAQHVLGESPEDIQRTFLLRRRYFRWLHDTVVELFASAKAFAENLYGHPLEARAHATWAQSPTIDSWRTGSQPLAPRQYEYTPDFLWSNTVQQAASACSDYFKWNEFLTGGGNDHAEGGWSDRNYYGLALACSTGSLNTVPNAYAAAWGMPAEIHRRHRALENAFGCSPDPAFAALFDYQHREVPVLFLYPSSLVACEERFGSWMVQYGYANYVTPEKLIEHARLLDGGYLDLAGRRYRTVAVLFEPLPPPELLPLLETFVSRGGRLIWSGPPARIDLAGTPILDRWQELCGIRALRFTHEGLTAPGSRITFQQNLHDLEPQPILTDFLVDQLYPVLAGAESRVVATAARQTVGLHRDAPAGGSVTYLGFRPRDDQAASLGHEVNTWFQILRRVGAYRRPPHDDPASDEDDPSVVSRTSPFLATRFPNGAVAIAVHYRHHVESWPGGFHRDAARDAQSLESNPPPPDTLELEGLRIAGHQVRYRGRLLVAFRCDATSQITGFAGYACNAIEVNGLPETFADRPLDFAAWAPVPESRRIPGGALWEIWVHGTGRVSLKLPGAPETTRLVGEGTKPGSRGAARESRWVNGRLTFDAAPGQVQGHLFLVPS